MTKMTDVAVIGAGPAGVGAALTAAQHGASVVLIDENEAPGGHLRWTMGRQDGFAPGVPEGLRGYELAGWAAAALTEAGVEVLASAIGWGLFEENTFGVTSESSTFQLRATSIIVATGSVDRVWPFPGWELPGVMTATAALRLMHLDRVLPGERVVVIGSGELAATVTADVQACEAPFVQQVRSVDDIAAGGDGRVEWLDTAGERVEVDAVVLAFGWQPDVQLALQAQVAIEFSKADGVFVPAVDDDFRTSDPGIFVVGGAAGTCSAAVAYAQGVVAGAAATGGTRLDAARAHLDGLDQLAQAIPAAGPIANTTMVCRCEEVRASALRDAIAAGAVGLNDLKRRTRGGMGICQGAYCQRAMATLISQEAGVAIETLVPITARPPARLIPMAAMADLEP
jgi:pyruvate/2-oxoglutarate dehydrogenase complex dihydrolipoamide dehydrogenase (E3) component/bacterioferritin-associated ferredoxin